MCLILLLILAELQKSVFRVESLAAEVAELEFAFDDLVVNSRAYRRAMGLAHAHNRGSGARSRAAVGRGQDITDPRQDVCMFCSRPAVMPLYTQPPPEGALNIRHVRMPSVDTTARFDAALDAAVEAAYADDLEPLVYDEPVLDHRAAAVSDAMRQMFDYERKRLNRSRVIRQVHPRNAIRYCAYMRALPDHQVEPEISGKDAGRME